MPAAVLLLSSALGAWACRAPGGVGSFGDPCAEDDDCAGRCLEPPGGGEGYCTSACDPAAEAPCPAGYACEELGEAGFLCVAVPLGAPCQAGTDCASGACRGDVCSACQADTDCPGAQLCEDDRAGVGYYVCLGGPLPLGAACAGGVECASGFCETPGSGEDAVCSECASGEGCPYLQSCAFDAEAGYFTCG